MSRQHEAAAQISRGDRPRGRPCPASRHMWLSSVSMSSSERIEVRGDRKRSVVLRVNNDVPLPTACNTHQAKSEKSTLGFCDGTEISVILRELTRLSARWSFYESVDDMPSFHDFTEFLDHLFKEYHIANCD